MMKIDVLTLFPAMLEEPLKQSILGKARKNGILAIDIHDLREYTYDRHRTADDAPYGGGEGMVMKPEPLMEALDRLRTAETMVILTSPQGQRFTQAVAESLRLQPHLLFICGHYEGVDDRVRQNAVDLELSVGDFITSGGEFPVLLIVDTIARLIEGVVGNSLSVVNETFSSGILDHPAYTRPAKYHDVEVPAILLSGHHANIERWRRKEALRRTIVFRPDLLENYPLSDTDREMLREIYHEIGEVVKRFDD